MATITTKKNFGYVGPVKSGSISIKRDGKTMFRVCPDYWDRKLYNIQATFNGGRTYQNTYLSFRSRDEAVAKAIDMANKRQ